jgi:hypothetical protein
MDKKQWYKILGKEHKEVNSVKDMITEGARPIYQIADEISRDWKKVNYAAKPYLEAMYSLDSINDKYIMDSGRSIVAYFLSNASTWRGETAKRIKKELNAMLKGR